MRLEKIVVQNFRNISSAEISFSEKSNVLFGENAQGKTNLLEAVYSLACGKSFRNSRYREMIRHGEKQAMIKALVHDGGHLFHLNLKLDEKSGKEIFKNDIKITKLSDFLGLFRVVLFCPEHLSLVKEGPGKRRSFIDGAICQLRPYYASLLNEFNKTEAQRAALLKQAQKKPVSHDLVRIWDERLAAVSVRIALLRHDYICRLQEYAPVHFDSISGGKDLLSLNYQSEVFHPLLSEEEMIKKYLSLLEHSFAGDQKYGFTQKGIHHDDLEISVNSYLAKSFASQGQQRSVVLSLKLAEGEISRTLSGQEPVYLMDDVLSELDEFRREYITAGLSDKQVILTGTDEKDFHFVEKKIRVKKGEFFE